MSEVIVKLCRVARDPWHVLNHDVRVRGVLNSYSGHLRQPCPRLSYHIHQSTLLQNPVVKGSQVLTKRIQRSNIMRVSIPVATAVSSFLLLASAQLLPFSHQPKQDIMQDNVLLSDAVGLDRSINIFAGLLRDVDHVANRIDSKTINTTILAPLNSAITALPRKPWEDPEDYAAFGTNAYDGQGGEDRAHRNLRRFVESHVLPDSPWKEGQKLKTMGGNTIWWQQKDGKIVVRCALHPSIWPRDIC